MNLLVNSLIFNIKSFHLKIFIHQFRPKVRVHNSYPKLYEYNYRDACLLNYNIHFTTHFFLIQLYEHYNVLPNQLKPYGFFLLLKNIIVNAHLICQYMRTFLLQGFDLFRLMNRKK
jgi:hypothetical protein